MGHSFVHVKCVTWEGEYYLRNEVPWRSTDGPKVNRLETFQRVAVAVAKISC